MIHSIYVMKSSGILLFGRDFRTDAMKEVVPGFFVGIKNFISELTNKTIKESMTILLDDMIIALKPITRLDVDVVLIVDDQDSDMLESWFEHVSAVLVRNSDLFREWNCMVSKFNCLTHDIETLMNDANDMNVSLLFSPKNLART